MSNAIVKHQDQDSGLTSWRAMREQADELVKSGFLPRAINTPEKAMAIIQTGKELGLGPMQSLRSIHIIEGKPTMSADLIAGLALAKVPGSVLRVAVSTNELCTIEAGRAGQKLTEFTFTMKDAQQAGLAGKSNWKNYPRAMLRARAITEAARAIFPDAVMGLYDPDELGAVTTEAGEVVTLAQVTELPQQRDHTPHAGPDEDHDAPPIPNEKFDAIIKALAAIEQRIKDSRTITWDDLMQMRAEVGSRKDKAAPTELQKEISRIVQSDEIAPVQRKEIGKVWNRIDRQLTRLEGIVPQPGPEETMREPGDESEEEV